MTPKLTIIGILSVCTLLAPPLYAKITIMPLGDSITHGVGPTFPEEDLNGYRFELWNLLIS